MRFLIRFSIFFSLLFTFPLSVALASESGFHADLINKRTIRAQGKWVQLTGWRTQGAGGLYDVENAFNESTGEFTVSKDGLYHFSANVGLNSARTGHFRLLLSINGNKSINNGPNAIRGENPKENDFMLHLSGVLSLKKGQKVTLWIYGSTDPEYTVQSESGFSGAYLGDKLQGFNAVLNADYRLRNRQNQYITLTNWKTQFTGGFNSGSFDASKGEFTVPSTGYYYFAGNARLDNAGGNYNRLLITVDSKPNQHNGLHSIDGSPYSNYSTMNVQGTVLLAKGQKITLQAYSNNDSDYTVQKESSFSGYYLGPGIISGFHSDLLADKNFSKAGWHQITGWGTGAGYFNIGFNRSTGEFTASTDGYYRFSTNLRFDKAKTTLVRMAFRINNSNDLHNGLHTLRNPTPDFYSLNLSGTVFLKRGDKVTLWVYSSDNSFQIHSESGFSGVLLRPMEHSGFHANLKGGLRFQNKTNQFMTLAGWRTTHPGGYNTGQFNITTGVFTASRNGFYNISGNARFDAAGGAYSRLVVAVNNRVDLQNGIHSIQGIPYSPFYTLYANGVLYLQKGSTLTLRSYSVDDRDYTIQAQTGFSAYFIGPSLSSGFHATLKAATRVRRTGYTRVGNWRVPSHGVGINQVHSDGNFNYSTGEYTAPVTGYYYVTGQVRLDGMQANSTIHYARLLASINGTSDVNSGLHTIKANIRSQYTTLSVAGTVRLSKGQKLSLLVYSNNDRDYYFQVESGFSAYLIGSSLVSGFLADKSGSKHYRTTGWQHITNWRTNQPGGFNSSSTHFNTTRGEFTAPIDGYYQLTSNARLDKANGNGGILTGRHFWYMMAINGVRDFNSGMTSLDVRTVAPYYSHNLAGAWFLKKGQKVTLHTHSRNDTDWHYHDESGFSAHLIGALNADSDKDGVSVSAGDCNDSDKTVFPAYNGKKAAPELCDGKDNDCNGKVDDNFKSTDCTPSSGSSGQKGNCARGSTSCKSGKVICIRNTPTVESCDGKDNDCDGNTDEICDCKPNQTQSCFSGTVGCTRSGNQHTCKGICKAGTQSCVAGGKWGKCIGEISGKKEICDGKDNNCDGSIDETFEGKGKPCKVTGQKGPCEDGNTACINGKMACQPKVRPGKEICDGKDNNCDGKVDETFEEKGKPCQVPNQKGPCAESTYSACTKGALVCPQSVQSSKEICDGKDNNCDGKADETFEEKGKPCQVPNQKGPCTNGESICDKGAIKCQQITKPTKEACDGKDNDCDGKVDNGASSSCIAGNICTNGQCVSLPKEPEPQEEPSPELDAGDPKSDATPETKAKESDGNPETNPKDNPAGGEADLSTPDTQAPPPVGCCAIRSETPQDQIFLFFGVIFFLLFLSSGRRQVSRNQEGASEKS